MKLREGAYFGTVRNRLEKAGLSISLTTYEPLQAQPWHTHEHPTLFLHLKGQHLDSLPHGQVSQPALSAVFHPASVEHRSDVGPQGMAGINIELRSPWLDRFHLTERDLGPERLCHTPWVSGAVLRLTLSALRSTDGEDIESLVFEIVAERPSRSQRDLSPPAWLRQAKKKIEDDVGTVSGVAELAREVGIDPGHLSQSFRRHFGCTVTSYIQLARLGLASRRMLSGTSAGSAALEAGFSDQFYLSRCMKRNLNLGPREVRRLHHSITGQP